MKSRLRCFFPYLLIFLLCGCAHVISKDLRANADLSLAFGQVRQNPNSYQGKSVVWGGEIIETVNQKDGTTQIEVFQRPLGWREEPNGALASEGRFLILAREYLDPYLFRKGRKITVAGEILGEKTKPLGEMDYRYPFLLSKQIYLWDEYDYRPYPYYYYPWWHDDLWWGYPYGWWGLRFYFPHHRH